MIAAIDAELERSLTTASAWVVPEAGGGALEVDAARLEADPTAAGRFLLIWTERAARERSDVRIAVTAPAYEAMVIRVVPDSPSHVVPLRKARRLRGRVLYPDGRPAADARVGCIPDSGDFAPWTAEASSLLGQWSKEGAVRAFVVATDRSGQFEVQLPAGHSTLRIETPTAVWLRGESVDQNPALHDQGEDYVLTDVTRVHVAAIDAASGRRVTEVLAFVSSAPQLLRVLPFVRVERPMHGEAVLGWPAGVQDADVTATVDAQGYRTGTATLAVQRGDRIVDLTVNLEREADPEPGFVEVTLAPGARRLAPVMCFVEAYAPRRPGGHYVSVGGADGGAARLALSAGRYVVSPLREQQGAFYAKESGRSVASNVRFRPVEFTIEPGLTQSVSIDPGDRAGIRVTFTHPTSGPAKVVSIVLRTPGEAMRILGSWSPTPDVLVFAGWPPGERVAGELEIAGAGMEAPWSRQIVVEPGELLDVEVPTPSDE